MTGSFLVSIYAVLAAIYAVWAAIYALSFRTRQPGREHLNHTFVPSISHYALKHVVALDILLTLLQRYMFCWFRMWNVCFGELKAKVHNYKKWVKRAELLLLEQLKFHVLDPLQCAKEMRFFDASMWARTFQKHLWSTHFEKTSNATKKHRQHIKR